MYEDGIVKHCSLLLFFYHLSLLVSFYFCFVCRASLRRQIDQLHATGDRELVSFKFGSKIFTVKVKSRCEGVILCLKKSFENFHDTPEISAARE